MLDNGGPSIDPCRTPAIIFLQSLRVLLIFASIGSDLRDKIKDSTACWSSP